MNLTSKRMLQIIAGCAGVFALSATAQSPWVSDNFEYIGADYGTTDGVADMPIYAYKCEPWGTSNEFTNYQWFVESSDDLSKLVSVPQNFSGPKRPIPGSDTQLVLSLETNGKTLVRTNNASLPISSSPLYVDTLIKFTPSEDNPTISDPSVKAAVFLDANLHLWIYHGVDSPGGAPTSSDTGLEVSTNEWHRLTIMLGIMPGSDYDYVFKVYVDNTEVSSADGMDNEYGAGGPWYWSASNEGSFAAVAFQGTGLVDELVVADTCDLTTDTAVWLTLDFDPAQVIVSTSNVSIARYDAVLSGTQIDVTAKPWYQITSGGALMGNATSNEFTTGVVTGIVGTVTGSNGETNTVTSEAFSSTSGLPTGFGGASIGGIMTWATNNGVNPEGLTDAMLDDYLLNEIGRAHV